MIGFIFVSASRVVSRMCAPFEGRDEQDNQREQYLQVNQASQRVPGNHRYQPGDHDDNE
jgi:hypothetical protein